jgi:hypothetical protein
MSKDCWCNIKETILEVEEHRGLSVFSQFYLEPHQSPLYIWNFLLAFGPWNLPVNLIQSPFLFSILFIFIIIAVLGGDHCSSYKDSNSVSNTSYLNSPFTALFHTPFPNSWNSFSRYHFCIYIHVYILFSPYSSSYPFPCHLPCSTPPTKHPQPPSSLPLGRTCSSSLFSDFCRRKSIK